MIFLQILNDTGMCKAGLPHDGLRSLCPNVVDLDISNNYLSNWSEVLNILSQLPCLKYVNVARNPLESKSVSFKREQSFDFNGSL